MCDPNTIAALAAEFRLQPDTVRLIMDAAEQHPGVVDPIALGKTWLRKRAAQERQGQAISDPQPHAFPRSTPEWGERADPEVAARELAKIRDILGDHRERVSPHHDATVPFSARED